MSRKIIYLLLVFTLYCGIALAPSTGVWAFQNGYNEDYISVGGATPENYDFKIIGAVEKPCYIMVAGLKTYPGIETRTKEYAWENSAGSTDVDTMIGVYMEDLLQFIPQLSEHATSITVTATDGYSFDYNLNNNDYGIYWTDIGGNKIMLAWRGTASRTDRNIIDFSLPRLIVGQKTPGDINRPMWISDISSITVNVEVHGTIKSYNPTESAIIRLLQEGETIYQTILPEETGYGLTEQTFTIRGVAPGKYDLVISKKAHTEFSIINLLVKGEILDLTKDTRPEIRLMTLRCGDINEDGMINNNDLMILWNVANYNKSTKEAINKNCDLNGDNMINNLDLTILWLPYNYNRGKIVIEYLP